MIEFLSLRHRPPLSRPRGQGGFVLAASLVAMAIIGLVIAALLSLTATATTTSAIIRDRAERSRVADNAVNVAMAQISRNYAGSTTGAMESAALLGTVGSTCGPFEFTLDGREVKVTCTPDFVPGNGLAATSPDDSLECGVEGNNQGLNTAAGFCLPRSSPGMLRRVKLSVAVSDRSGGNFKIHAVARVNIVDLDPTTGRRANGRTISIDRLDLCNLPSASTECLNTP